MSIYVSTLREVHAPQVPPELRRLQRVAASVRDDGLAGRADAAGGRQPEGGPGRPLGGAQLATADMDARYERAQ